MAVAAELRLVDRFLGTDDDAPSCLWSQRDPLTGKSALLGRMAQHLWSSPKFDVVGHRRRHHHHQILAHTRGEAVEGRHLFT
ncbi:hypothetical protein [Streptomyces sp. NPDC101178]|uniref:hypothetical protein n=1 Tax=Streptomyces sp. NPDC101178 TaxID=3366124 RepID=UPI00382B96B3